MNILVAKRERYERSVAEDVARFKSTVKVADEQIISINGKDVREKETVSETASDAKARKEASMPSKRLTLAERKGGARATDGRNQAPKSKPQMSSEQKRETAPSAKSAEKAADKPREVKGA